MYRLRAWPWDEPVARAPSLAFHRNEAIARYLLESNPRRPA